MYSSKIDVPVLMIFFIRPDKLRQVFEQVRLARPSELFLFQDGARNGNVKDEALISECRKIVTNIDWNCKVHTLYSDFNYGVDSSVFAAIKWAFESVDRLIILEDDIVASQSFFEYSKQLLDKYQDDAHISMIGGMNHLEAYNDEEADYFFAESCAIWGWATWKRFFNKWDRELNFLADKDALKKIRSKISRRKYRIQLKKGLRVRNEALRDPNKASFESSSFFANLLNDGCAIIPTKNLITNIGIGEGTFHATDSIKKITRRMQKLFYMARYELRFPLRPPLTNRQDEAYNKKINQLMYPNIFIRILVKIESRIRRIIFR